MSNKYAVWMVHSETISPQSEESTQWGRRRMIVEFTASYLCNHDVVSSNLDQGDKLVVF